MGIPTISVTFKRLAESANTRSERGVLAIILQDGAAVAAKTYASLAEVPESEYTADNYKALKRAFLAEPHRVVAVCVKSSGTMNDAQGLLDTLSYNWVCSPVSSFQTQLVTYVKAQNTASRIRKVKAVVAGVTSADDEHIINVANTNVTEQGSSTTVAMAQYLPRIAGIIAACPLTESVTGYALTDLTAVAAVASLDTSIDAGNLCLHKDDDTFRIARGVNTLQTLGATKTADMKKITVVEAMDIIQEDIIHVFKDRYLGKCKNTAANQSILVADIIGYLRDLIAEGVLDENGTNTVAVDVSAMRTVWAAAGVDCSEMTDAQVAEKTYHSDVYLVGSVRIPDAIEDLHMVIQLA